jgi:ferredoxin
MMYTARSFIGTFLALCLIAKVTAFGVIPRANSAAPSSTTRLHFFGGLSNAFKNDDGLGKPQNAGLKNGPKYNDNVTVNGKKVEGAVAGQKLTAVANKVRVKIPVNCQKGDCGTCTVKLNGRQVKACSTPLPTGKAKIETL